MLKTIWRVLVLFTICAGVGYAGGFYIAKLVIATINARKIK